MPNLKQSETMDLDIIVSLAETLTILGGVLFAIVQIRNSNRQHARELKLHPISSYIEFQNWTA